MIIKEFQVLLDVIFFVEQVGQSPLPLKHLSRVFLRQQLGDKLPYRIDELNLPMIMKKYLLYEIS